MIPNVLIIGEPGSGKSVGAAADALRFPGSRVILDPHKDSIGRLVLEHATGFVLYDRLDDLDHALGYGLLKPSCEPNPLKCLQENQRRARLYVQVLMRRRGGEITSAPLMEEWIMALLMLFLYQCGTAAYDPALIPFGFRPGTDEFAALLRDCQLAEIRHKFQQLSGLHPRALRAEVGSASRLIDGVFRDPSFQLRCRASFDLSRALQSGVTLIVERGNADEDVTRTIIGGINLLVTEHCESRTKPSPPVGIWLDECTNGRTAGDFEARKAGETRKASLHWRFICQHPNFPGGSEGFFQNCQEKHFYRTGDHALARKLAGFVVGSTRRGEQSRAELIDAVVADLMTFPPGWRFVVGQSGSRKEYVPLLTNPWPDWPGLREAKLQEKLRWIYARPEYGSPVTPLSSNSSTATPQQPPSLQNDSSPARRFKRGSRKPADGSSGSGDVDACA
jgi:hypothetical protein